MVDAAASFDGNRVAANEASVRPMRADQGRWTATASDGTGLADYVQFCASAVFAPAQSASWVSNWATATGADIVVATLACEGRPALSLALEVIQRGPFKLARFTGGRHANGNFAAADPRFLPAVDGPAIHSCSRQSPRRGRTST